MALGPWIWSGWTSGSATETSRPEFTATPLAHRPASLSASASHHWFSATRNSTGSLMMPPSAAVMSTYLHWPTAHRVRSLRGSLLMNSEASAPLISTTRSTATSHSVTSLIRLQYSVTGSS